MAMSTRHKRIVEQVRQYGVEYLSDAELLALVLGKGTVSEHEKVVARMQALLTERGGIAGMLRLDLGELLQDEFEAGDAACLHALMELARRLTRPAVKGYQVKSADDIAQLVGSDLRYLDHEEMRVLLLDTKNYVTANLCLYRGTIDSSVMRVAEMLRPAIIRQCPRVVLCHNHPSGDPAPSPEDRLVTRQCVDAAKLLDIELLDHIIIGNPRFLSLKQAMQW